MNNNPYLPMFFNLGNLIGQGIANRQAEGDYTKSLREQFGSVPDENGHYEDFALNPLDPNYKQKLYLNMKNRGDNAATIGKFMQDNEIDKQIKDARTGFYTGMFNEAMKGNAPDFQSASTALTGLVSENPQVAGLLGNYYPTAKDTWTSNINQSKLNQTLKAKEDARNAQNAFTLKRDSIQNNYKLNQIGYEKSLDFNNRAKIEQFKSDLDRYGKKVDMQTRAELANKLLAGGQLTKEQATSYMLTGNLGKGNSGANSKEKQELSNLYKWKDMFEKQHATDADDSWQNDSTYKSVVDRINDSVSVKYDPTSYDDMVSLVTDAIESGQYTQQEIENALRNKTDMADNILGNVDWEAWRNAGYLTKG